MTTRKVIVLSCFLACATCAWLFVASLSLSREGDLLVALVNR